MSDHPDDDDNPTIDLTVDPRALLGLESGDDDEDAEDGNPAISPLELSFQTAGNLRARATTSEEEATDIEDGIMKTPTRSASDLVVKLRLLCRHVGVTEDAESDDLTRTEFYAWTCLQDLIALISD